MILTKKKQLVMALVIAGLHLGSITAQTKSVTSAVSLR